MVIENGDSLEDMSIEILAKLPVKSLVRFRWVCKSWFNLIKDPIFISKHLKNDNNTRLIIIYAKEVEKGSDTEEETADGSKPVEPRDFLALYPDETLEDLSFQELESQQPVIGLIWGPYSGIMIIIGVTNLVTLWNIATQESRTLPKLSILSQYYIRLHTTEAGFGLDLVTHDYKLVLIMKLLDEKRMLLYEFHHIAVYTLGNNSWRVFESSKSFLNDISSYNDSVYWDGAFYWLLESKNDNQIGILSFNLRDEEFQEIKGPNSPESADVTLDVYNDSLTVLFFGTNSHCFEAWVLKNGNWIKLFTVGTFIGFYKPLQFWKKGSFFVELNTRQLLLYEPSTGEMRDFELDCLWFSTHIYKESLITIKGGANLLNE